MKSPRCRTAVARFLRDESGPASVEYAVMLALITAAIFGSVVLVGAATAGNFDLTLDTILDAFGR